MAGLKAVVLSVLDVVRNAVKARDVKADLGALNVTAEQFAAPGEDSQPRAGDYVALLAVKQTGGLVAVGYLDPKNPQVAQAGERRLYSRGSNGDAIAAVWLKADGSVVIDAPGGVTVNGTLSADAVSAPSITANGVEVAGHIHTQPNDTGGDTEAPTNAMQAGP